MSNIPSGWIFSRSKSSPSFAIQQKLTVFIHDLGKELKLPDRFICSSIIFMRRFYAMQSSVQFLPQRLAAAIVFLTCKIYDGQRALQDIVVALVFLLTGKTVSPDDDSTKHYRDDLIRLENILLSTFAFNFNIDFPHEFIRAKFHELKQSRKDSRIVSMLEDVERRSFHLATKSIYLTSFSVNYPADQIAGFTVESTLRSLSTLGNFQSIIDEIRQEFSPNQSINHCQNLIEEFQTIQNNYPVHWYQRMFPSTGQSSRQSQVDPSSASLSPELEFSSTLTPSIRAVVADISPNRDEHLSDLSKRPVGILQHSTSTGATTQAKRATEDDYETVKRHRSDRSEEKSLDMRH